MVTGTGGRYLDPLRKEKIDMHFSTDNDVHMINYDGLKALSFVRLYRHLEVNVTKY